MLKKSKFDKEEKKTLTIKSKILDYSARKLAPFAKLLVGKSIDEALKICEVTTSKGAHYAKNYLTKLKNLIEHENKYQLRYFYIIRECYVGTKRGTRMPFPRAKGKADIHTAQKSRLNFKVTKIPAEEKLKEIALGKGVLSFSEANKSKLFTENASLSDIKKNAFYLTAKGRNYRHQQFKRLIFYLRKRYYENHEIKLSKIFIAEEIKRNLGKNLLQYMNNLPIDEKEFNELNNFEKGNHEIRESFFETFCKEINKKQSIAIDLEKRRALYKEKMRDFE